MDPPELPASARKMLIRDGDGFDGDGLDEEGYDLLGFNAAGLNQTGQSVSNFPPEFFNDLARTANAVRRSGGHWVPPPVLNMEAMRKKYPRWYAMQEAIFPEEEQVRLNSICAGSTTFTNAYLGIRVPRPRRHQKPARWTSWSRKYS
jgi:hypothetical protein